MLPIGWTGIVKAYSGHRRQNFIFYIFYYFFFLRYTYIFCYKSRACESGDVRNLLKRNKVRTYLYATWKRINIQDEQNVRGIFKLLIVREQKNRRLNAIFVVRSHPKLDRLAGKLFINRIVIMNRANRITGLGENFDRYLSIYLSIYRPDR